MRTWLQVGAFHALCCVTACVARAETVVLTAADGVKVYGEVTRAAAQKSPVILAFHMAGSNHAEYAPIAPRLAAAGFTVLAIDQRSGGTQFGAHNRTAEALGKPAGYRAALPDLEAALAWGKSEARGAPVLVWGSSYSAALVFLLAAAHPGDVAGLLAFSPDEYLGAGDPVHTAARKLAIPVLVSQAKDAGEIAAARSILAAVPGNQKTQFVPITAGVHGSSSLREDVNPRGAAEYWTAVLGFLARFKGA